MLYIKILVIYPEVKQTKIAIYQNAEVVFLKTLKHKAEQLAQFADVIDQLPMRVALIMNELNTSDFDLSTIRVIIARGGLIKPVLSGVYEVNERMKEDLRKGIMGQHAINLGGLIADEIAHKLPDAKAYLGDPVVVDELSDMARVSGHPLIVRKSIFHALNHKYCARAFAKSTSKSYQDLNLVVAHVGGGGISVGAHQKGHVVDVNQAFQGDGPFTFTRSGSLPVGDLVNLCFSGQYTHPQILNMITEEGGLSAYLGTSSLRAIETNLAAGDEKTIFYVKTMAYQVAKEIGAMTTVLEGKVDAILLTGNFFSNRIFAHEVFRRIEHLGKINVYPVVNDLDSLAANGMKVLKDATQILEYQ
ncbi:MAG: butyrate kinase [Bacteroidales bacterium]|nr:butyrate kinase [Bacteroidales bacterium]MDZ4203418.1 butyrate kinase [Bacteroidales bacterium]